MISETVARAIYSGKDMMFAFLMLICGFLYWNLISPVGLGAGVLVFTGVFCTTVALYLREGGFRQNRRSLTCLALVVLSAFVFLLYDNMLIKAFDFIFLSAAVIYWICLVTEKNLEDRISIYFLGDMVNQAIVVPFGNFGCCFGSIAKPAFGTQRRKSILGGMLGILMILPVLIAVIGLLSAADAAFEQFVASLRFSLSKDIVDYLIQMILGVPVACYLFGLVYGDRYERKTGGISIESVDRRTAGFRCIPGVTVHSAMTALNAIYAVFFITQAAYLFSAFGNILPEMMTYSAYARRGFFELCAVAGINLAVLAFVHIFAKRESSVTLRIETAALCIFTMMLIATALSKMGMYIEYYGMTQLRAYTTWFMILLLFMFVVITARQFKRFNGTRIMLAGFVVLFMILCYGNIDGLIARYNIDRYNEGTIADLDVEALGCLSDAALPYIYEAYRDSTDDELRTRIKDVMIQRAEFESAGGNRERSFRDFNLQSYKAKRIMDQFRTGV